MQNYDKSNGLRSGWFRIFSSGGRFAIEYLLSLTSDGSGTRNWIFGYLESAEKWV